MFINLFNKHLLSPHYVPNTYEHRQESSWNIYDNVYVILALIFNWGDRTKVTVNVTRRDRDGFESLGCLVWGWKTRLFNFPTDSDAKFPSKNLQQQKPGVSGQGECVFEFGKEWGLLVKLHGMIMDVSQWIKTWSWRALWGMFYLENSSMSLEEESLCGQISLS